MPITVSDDKVTRTFVITQFTEINVNGQRATVADLRPGMVVNVTMDTDPARASRSMPTARRSIMVEEEVKRAAD